MTSIVLVPVRRAIVDQRQLALLVVDLPHRLTSHLDDEVRPSVLITHDASLNMLGRAMPLRTFFFFVTITKRDVPDN